MGTINTLTQYPIKSLPGFRVSSLEFTPEGFKDDRLFMIATPNGTMVTLRHVSALAKFTLSRDEHRLLVSYPGGGTITIPFAEPTESEFPVETVTIHDKKSQMVHLNTGDFDLFFTECLKRPVKFMRSASWIRRMKHSNTLGRYIPLQAQDGYPALILSEAARTDLNDRLVEKGRGPVHEQTFRENVLVGGIGAHAEDALRPIAFEDGAVFDREKLCSRCPAITVHLDPRSPYYGRFDPENEPRRTLNEYRQIYADRENIPNVYFGVNALPRGSGVLKVGMQITSM